MGVISMGLSNDLISLFVKATKDDTKTNNETTVYGTTVERDGNIYVMIDGASTLTPVTTTTNVKPNERVTVMIKNHTATITGNISSPAARTEEVQEVNEAVTNLRVSNIIIDEAMTAANARIDTLEADNVNIKSSLSTTSASIETLITDNTTINEKLTANSASIETLEADNAEINEKLVANTVDIKKLEVDNAKINETLNANSASIGSLAAEDVKINEKLTANSASIKKLETEKISAKDIEGKYANIDFSNIGKAAFEYLFSESGLIENIVVGDGTITGNLVGVTITGDLIEGNTIKAEKLVIKGTDGLYYKLNTDGVTTEAEQTNENSLNGSIITAKSITASKISVDDLVAFDATIGGFNITDSAIYSGVKESVDNTTRGVYLDKEGQVAIGDASNFLKYYKDDEGNYKLEISTNSILLGSSGKSVETMLTEAQTSADNAQSTADETGSRVTAAETLLQLLADSISMLVTDGNGESLMTQTENGWTFSTGQIQNTIDTTSENLDALTNTVGNVSSTVGILQQAVDDLGILSEYVKITTYEDEPCIELGETDSDFKLLITNTRIMFMEGTGVPAYINNQSLYIRKAVIEEELQQGEFVWKARSNGNLGLIWKGVTS